MPDLKLDLHMFKREANHLNVKPKDRTMLHFLISFSWPNPAPIAYRVSSVVTVPAVRVVFSSEDEARVWAEAMLRGLPERAAYALATATLTHNT